MERIDTSVLDKFEKNLDEMLKEAPEMRAELHRRVGVKIKEALDVSISGTISDREGKVRGWQIVAVGSGGGYVAIRPKGSKEGGEVGPNGPGAITNYLSAGHSVRKPSGRAKRYTPRGRMLVVRGRKFYQATDAQAQQIALAEAQKLADEVARKMVKGL